MSSLADTFFAAMDSVINPTVENKNIVNTSLLTVASRPKTSIDMVESVKIKMTVPDGIKEKAVPNYVSFMLEDKNIASDYTVLNKFIELLKSSSFIVSNTLVTAANNVCVGWNSGRDSSTIINDVTHIERHLSQLIHHLIAVNTSNETPDIGTYCKKLFMDDALKLYGYTEYSMLLYSIFDEIDKTVNGRIPYCPINTYVSPWNSSNGSDTKWFGDKNTKLFIDTQSYSTDPAGIVNGLATIPSNMNPFVPWMQSSVGAKNEYTVLSSSKPTTASSIASSKIIDCVENNRLLTSTKQCVSAAAYWQTGTASQTKRNSYDWKTTRATILKTPIAAMDSVGSKETKTLKIIKTFTYHLTRTSVAGNVLNKDKMGTYTDTCTGNKCTFADKNRGSSVQLYDYTIAYCDWTDTSATNQSTRKTIKENQSTHRVQFPRRAVDCRGFMNTSCPSGGSDTEEGVAHDDFKATVKQLVKEGKLRFAVRDDLNTSLATRFNSMINVLTPAKIIAMFEFVGRYTVSESVTVYYGNNNNVSGSFDTASPKNGSDTSIDAACYYKTTKNLYVFDSRITSAYISYLSNDKNRVYTELANDIVRYIARNPLMMLPYRFMSGDKLSYYNYLSSKLTSNVNSYTNLESPFGSPIVTSDSNILTKFKSYQGEFGINKTIDAICNNVIQRLVVNMIASTSGAPIDTIYDKIRSQCGTANLVNSALMIKLPVEAKSIYEFIDPNTTFSDSDLSITSVSLTGSEIVNATGLVILVSLSDIEAKNVSRYKKIDTTNIRAPYVNITRNFNAVSTESLDTVTFEYNAFDGRLYMYWLYPSESTDALSGYSVMSSTKLAESSVSNQPSAPIQCVNIIHTFVPEGLQTSISSIIRPLNALGI